MNVKKMAEIVYMYDMQIIAEAREVAGKILHRERREEVDYEFSFDDKHFESLS